MTDTDTARFVERVAQDGRSYRLFLPSSRDGPAPVVVALHGCTQDAADIAAGTRLNEHAERRGFIVVYPEQPPSAHPQSCWNWYLPTERDREAVSIVALTRAALEEHGGDPDRVYLLGMSAGAAMVSALLADYPERWAGAAIHSGIEYGAASGLPEAAAVLQRGGPPPGEAARAAVEAMGGRARPIPVIGFHGKADPTVAVVNGYQTLAQWAATYALAADAGRAAGPVAMAPPCPEVPGLVVEHERGRAGGRAYDRCRYRSSAGTLAAEGWFVDGLGHAWSGGSPDGTYTDPAGPDATGVMLAFLLGAAGDGGGAEP